MKPSELSILLGEGEGTMLEYKEALSSSFARELVALANTAGGKMLLGVRDDGTVKGIADSNALRARIQDIARNCDPPVTVLVEPVGEVMVVTVRESDAGRGAACRLQALELAQRNYETRPYGEAAVALAHAWLQNAQPKRAVDVLESHLADGWDTAEIHWVLGEAWARLSQQDAAGAARRAALR